MGSYLFFTIAVRHVLRGILLIVFLCKTLCKWEATFVAGAATYCLAKRRRLCFNGFRPVIRPFLGIRHENSACEVGRK